MGGFSPTVLNCNNNHAAIEREPDLVPESRVPIWPPPPDGCVALSKVAFQPVTRICQ